MNKARADDTDNNDVDDHNEDEDQYDHDKLTSSVTHVSALFAALSTAVAKASSWRASTHARGNR